jgi:hypothetical protein
MGWTDPIVAVVGQCQGGKMPVVKMLCAHRSTRKENMNDEQDEANEQSWLAGNTAAYSSILMECARHLDADDPLRDAAKLIAERRDVIAALRNMCIRFNLLNDWCEGKEEDLYLADVISNLEKELSEVLE